MMNRTTNKELLDGQYDLLSSIISTPESSFRLIAKDTNAKDEEEHKDNGCSNRDNIDKKGEEQEVEEDSSAPEEFEPIPFGPAVFLSSGAAAASDDDHGVAGDAYAKEHLLHQQQMYKGEQERGQETKKQLKERDKYQEYGGKCTMLPHSFDSTNSSRSEFPPCHYPTGNNYHYSYHYHGAPMGRTYGWGMQETSRYRELGAGKSNDDDSSSRFCHDGLATSTTHSSHDRERWSNQYHYNYGQEDDKSRSSMSTRTSMSYSTCGGGKEKGKSHEYHGDTTRGFYRHHVQQNQGQLGSENASWHGKSLHHEQDDSRRVHGHEYNSYSLSYYDHRTNTNSNTSSTINHHFNDSRIGHGWHNGDTSFGNKAVTTTASSTDESMATHVASNQQCRHTQNSANYPHVTTTQSTTVQQLHSTNDNYVFQRCSLQQQQQQHNWYMSGEVNDSYQHSCYNNESLATSQYHGYDTNSTILEHHHRHQHQPHFGVSNIVQDPSHSLHSSTFADVFVDVDDEQKRNSSYASFGSNFYTNNTITSSSTTNDISPGDVQSMGAGDWPLQFHEQHDNHGNEQETDQKNWSSKRKACNDDQSPHSSRAADEILATIPQKLRRISNDGSSSTPRTAGPLESKCQKSAHDDDGDVEDDTIHHTCASFIPETTGNHVHDDDHQQQQQQSQQEPLLIVISSDKKYATKYSYRVMKEVTLAHFDESDRRGKRQKIPLGFPGLACRHCHGVRTLPSAIHNDLILPTYQRTGRYFPSTLKSFSDTKKTLNAIFSHLIRCQKCPQEVKQNLIKLEKEHSSERASKNYGSQSRFFLRIWHRIHKKDKPRSISTSTSNTEE